MRDTFVRRPHSRDVGFMQSNAPVMLIPREVFPAADITQARQHAITRVKYPNTPEFLNCLDFYYVPFKTLQWKDWQEPREPDGETQIHSCESQSFLNGVFKWIVKILVSEVDP